MYHLKRCGTRAAVLLACLLVSLPLAAEEVRVVSFNVEHGWQPDADLETIARQMEGYTGVDLWGLSEVGAVGWVARLTQAAQVGGQAPFAAVLGTPTAERLLALYNTNRFDKVAHWELLDIHARHGGRASLVLHLRLKTSGTEFLFPVNHLHRRAADKHSHQARELNAWARQQALPIIAVGDYNFDWNIPPALPYHCHM